MKSLKNYKLVYSNPFNVIVGIVDLRIVIVGMYSYVYHADKSHNLSIQSLYTFCSDFNYLHILDQRGTYKFCGISKIGSHIFGNTTNLI